MDGLTSQIHGHTYICYHGTEEKFDDFIFDEHRGGYFTTNEECAEDGVHVVKCQVTLSNPIIYSEEDSFGVMEIYRKRLMQMGYDGRIIEYDNGDKNVIAFHEGQVDIIEWI